MVSSSSSSSVEPMIPASMDEEELRERDTQLFGRRGADTDVALGDPLRHLSNLPDVVGFAKRCLMDADYGVKDALLDVFDWRVEVPTFRSNERDNMPHFGKTEEWFDKIRYPKRDYGATLTRLFPSAIIRTWVSDVHDLMRNSTTLPCYYAEIKALECLEHFGYNKGKTACIDYFDDYHECTSKPLQHLRLEAMKKQKNRRRLEVMMGERESTGEYPIPKPHAYQELFSNPNFPF